MKAILRNENECITAFHKGFPLASVGKSVSAFIAEKPNIFSSGFQFPLMILRESALNHNIKRMADYCSSIGAVLAPHVKTSMAPKLAQMQINSGAWALTVANFYQASVFLNFGFRRFIIGNEVVEPTAIQAIGKINLKPDHQIIFYLDSMAGLEILKSSISKLVECKIYVLLEIGVENGRTGIRELSLASEILDGVAKDDRIEVLGVSGFEGIVPEGARNLLGEEKIRSFLRKIVLAAKIVAPHVKNEKIIISAGGSSFFDFVMEEFQKHSAPCTVILRSGGYVSHDHDGYGINYPFLSEVKQKQFYPALELWSQVLSCPEPGLALLNFGKRDTGNDVNNPRPIKKFDGKLKNFTAEIEKLNDQHGCLKLMGEILNVGEIVGMGISHPCTNFDKWKLIPLVDNNYNVIDCIETDF